MNARTLRDFTLSANEIRVVREALIQYIIDNAKCATHLRAVSANRMAEAVSVDVNTASAVLRVIDPN